MTKQQEMQNDMAFWLEEVGYIDVLDALIDACRFWATAGEEPPPDGPAEKWAARERALRHALRETE